MRQDSVSAEGNSKQLLRKNSCVIGNVSTLNECSMFCLLLLNVAYSRDKRGRLAYYVELTFDLVILLIDLLHHLHMLVWSNILLSMASLVIVMQLRYLVHEIQRKVKKHRNYLWVQNHMERTYPLATASELSQNSDNCAICWEKMETARKLPCSHLFHK